MYQLFRLFKIRPDILLSPFKEVVVVPTLPHVKQAGQQLSIILRQNLVANELKADNSNQSSVGMRHDFRTVNNAVNA